MALKAPQGSGFSLSPTVEGVRKELGEAPVPAAAIIRAILGRHSDYGPAASLSIAWSGGARTASADEWLSRAARLLSAASSPTLHGRIAILTLALLEPVTGRAAVSSGLFKLIAEQLTPPFTTVLSEEGVTRLRRVPLAATALGLPPRGLPAGDGAGRVQRLAFSPDCSSLALDDGSLVRIVDAADGSETARVHAQGQIRAIDFSPHGDRVVVGGEFGVGVWTTEGHPVKTPTHSAPVVSVAFAPSARRIAFAGSGGVTMWYLDGDAVAETLAHGESILSVAFAPDGQRLVLGAKDGASLYDISTPTGQVTSPQSPAPARLEHSGAVWTAAFSADGSEVVTAVDGTARLWQVDPPSVVRDFGSGITAVALSPDAALLATAQKDVVDVWSVATGVEVAALDHDWEVTDLAFSSDGKLLATAGEKVLLWHVALGDRELRLSGYSADDARRGDDLLRIGADVDGFAQLIAAKTITPPLSIGIFGDWGSGKSFFMNRLRQRVHEFAREARESGELQRDISFYKRIAQVEFNAWHYAESDLWASLVEHILANLKIDPDETPSIVADRQKRLLDQLQVETAAADRATKKQAQARRRLREAEQQLEQAREKEEQLRNDLARAVGEDPFARVELEETAKSAILKALADAGMPAVAESVQELEATTRQASEFLERSRVLAALSTAPDSGRRFKLLVAILITAPVVALVAGVVARAVGASDFAGISAAAAGAATLFAAGARWVRSQLEWSTERLKEIEDARRQLEAPIQKAIADQRAEQVRLEKELESLLEQQRATQREKEAQLDRVREVEAELAAATPSRLLARFLQDRVESDDYRKRLGVLALVRRDFEAISEYLDEQTNELLKCVTLEEEEKDEAVRINRIVLYIDDLDRCEPRTVVEVLQAVHLLLAFPLFVVVVAVDVRWLERSLAKQYPDLLRTGGGSDGDGILDAAAPRDYLEKIFQIPFWIEPLDSVGSRRMLRGLVRSIVGADGGDGAASGFPAPPDDDGATAAPSRLEAPVEAAGGGGAAAPAVFAAAPPSTDLNPESLDLRPAEIAFMEQLAPIVGRTPRAVKRFVNVYRLIKASARDVRSFVNEREPFAPYRLIMLLLAVETGLPSIAVPLLSAVGTGVDQNADMRTLSIVLGTIRPSAAPDEMARLDAWLAQQKGVWNDVPVRTLAEWAEEVARFSFRLRPAALASPRPNSLPAA